MLLSFLAMNGLWARLRLFSVSMVPVFGQSRLRQRGRNQMQNHLLVFV